MDCGVSRRGRRNGEGGTQRQVTPRLEPVRRCESGRSHPHALKGRQTSREELDATGHLQETGGVASRAFGIDSGARPSGCAKTRFWRVSVGQRFRVLVGWTAFGSFAADTTVSTLDSRVRRHHFGVSSASERPQDSVGEMKSMRGVLRSVTGTGSLLEEDGEDQVERPRSRPERRNQSRVYSRSLDPEGRIQLRERQVRRETDVAHGQRLSGSDSPASGQQRHTAFGRGVGPGTRSPSPSGGSGRRWSAVAFGRRAGTGARSRRGRPRAASGAERAGRTARARSARPSGRAARRLREQRGQRVHFGGSAGQEPGELGALETLKSDVTCRVSPAPIEGGKSADPANAPAGPRIGRSPR